MALWWSDLEGDGGADKRWREVVDSSISVTKRFKLLLTLQADRSPMDIAEFYHDEYAAILALYGAYVKALQGSTNAQKSKPLTIQETLGLCGVLRHALLSTPAEVDQMQQNFLWSEILAFVQPTVHPTVRLAGVGLLALFVHVFMDDPTDDRLIALMSALEWGPFLRGFPEAAPPGMPFCYRLPAAFVPTQDPTHLPTEADALRTFRVVFDTAKGLTPENQRYDFWWKIIKQWLLGCLYPTEERLLQAVPTHPYPKFPSCALSLHQLVLNFLADGMSSSLPAGVKCVSLLGTYSDSFITRAILRFSFTYGLRVGRRCIFTTLEILNNWVASEHSGFTLRYHSPASFVKDVDGMCLNIVLLASNVFDWVRADLPRDAMEAFQECCLAVLQLYFQVSHRKDLRPNTHGQIFELYTKTVRTLIPTPSMVSHVVVDVASRLAGPMWILNFELGSPNSTAPVARQSHALALCLMQVALHQSTTTPQKDQQQLHRSASHRGRGDESLCALIGRLFEGAAVIPRPTDSILLTFHDHLALDELGGPAIQHSLMEILSELDADRAGWLWQRLLCDHHLSESAEEEVAVEQVKVVCDVVKQLLSLPLSDAVDSARAASPFSQWDLTTLTSSGPRPDRSDPLTADMVMEIFGPRLLQAAHSPSRFSASLACEALCSLLTYAPPGMLPERFCASVFHALARQLQEWGTPHAVLLHCLPTSERHVNVLATEQPGCGVLLLPLFQCAQQVLRHHAPQTDVVAAALRALMTVTTFAYLAPTSPAVRLVEGSRWATEETLAELRPRLVDVLEAATGVLTTSCECVGHLWAVLLLLTKEVQSASPSSLLVQRLLTVLCAALVNRKLDSGFAAHAAVRCFISMYLSKATWVDPTIVAFVHSSLCTAALLGMKEYRNKPRGTVLCSLLLTLRAAVLATPADMLLRLHVAPALCHIRDTDAPPMAQGRLLMSLVTDTLRYAITSFPALSWEVCQTRIMEVSIPVAHPPTECCPSTPSNGSPPRCSPTLSFPAATPNVLPPLHTLWWCDSTGNLVKEMDPLPGTTSADIRDLGRFILAQLLEQVGSPATLLSCKSPPLTCQHHQSSPPPATNNHPKAGCFHLSFNHRLVSYCHGSTADEVGVVSRTPIGVYTWTVQCRHSAFPSVSHGPPTGPETQPRDLLHSEKAGDVPVGAVPHPSVSFQNSPSITDRTRGKQENTNLREMCALLSQRQPQLVVLTDGFGEPSELQDLLSHWPTSHRCAPIPPFQPAAPPATASGSGDPVKRLLTMGMMDTYAERKSTMCAAEESAFQQLISKLDTMPLRDRVHVAVVYVGRQQDSWQQALCNEQCSAGLTAFLSCLGHESPARDLLGPTDERVVLSPAYSDLPVFMDATVEAVFHVLPRYPVSERSTKLETCDVVFAWSEDLAYPQGSTIRHRPTLRLCPLPSGLYYVQSNSTMGPTVSGTLLDCSIAVEYVRQTLLNAKLGRGQSRGCYRLRELSSFSRSITDMTRRTLPRLTLATSGPSPHEPSTPFTPTESSFSSPPPLTLSSSTSSMGSLVPPPS